MPLYNPEGGAGEAWTNVTGTTQAIVKTNHYIANNVSQVVLTLPATAAIGDFFSVAGKGAGGWKIAQNASQRIYMGTSATTAGTGGSVTSTSTRDGVKLICTTANTDFNVVSYVGNVTIV